MKFFKSAKFIYIPILIGYSLYRFFHILGADRVGPIHDPLSLRHLSRILYDAVFTNGVPLSLFFEHLHGSIYPPLIHFTALPFMVVFGPEKGAEYSFSLYLVVILLSTWGIAHRLAGERAAFLALIFAVCTPLLDTFARVYMVDYPMAAVATLVVYLLVASEGFSKRKPVIFLGLAVGAGLMIKQTIALYIGLPFVAVAAYYLLIKNDPERKKRIVNLTIFSLVAAPVPILWHAPGLFEFLSARKMVSAFYAGIEPEQVAVIEYFWLLVRRGLGPVLALGAAYGLIKTIRLKKYWLLWLWALPPLFFIDFFQGLISSRYLLPILPAFVILFAIGLDSTCRRMPLRFAWFATGLIILVVAAAFHVTLGVPTGDPFSFEDFHKRFQERGLVRPARLDWNVEEPAKKILSAPGKGQIVFLLNSPYSERLQGVLWDEQLLLAVDTLIERTSIGLIPPEIKNAEAISAYLDSAGWILLHSKYRDGYHYINYSNPIDAKVVLPVFEHFFKIAHQFALVGKYDYPEGGGYALLYARW